MKHNKFAYCQSSEWRRWIADRNVIFSSCTSELMHRCHCNIGNCLFRVCNFLSLPGPRHSSVTPWRTTTRVNWDPLCWSLRQLTALDSKLLFDYRTKFEPRWLIQFLPHIHHTKFNGMMWRNSTHTIYVTPYLMWSFVVSWVSPFLLPLDGIIFTAVWLIHNWLPLPSTLTSAVAVAPVSSKKVNK